MSKTGIDTRESCSLSEALMTLNRTEAIQPDSFVDVASKLRLLIGKERAARVLLIGDLYANDVTSFNRAFESVTVESVEAAVAPTKGCEYDLICFDSRSAPASLRVPTLCSDLCRRLARGGSLVLALDDRASRAAFRIRNGAERPRFAHKFDDVTHAVASSGMAVSAYLALPSLDHPDEFVDSSVASAVSGHPSTLRRVGAFLRMLDARCTEYLIFATAPEAGNFRSLTMAVERALGLDPGLLRVERFAMRRRGSLVTVMSDVPRRHPIVLRIAANAQTSAVLARNAECTDGLHRSSMPHHLKSLIPRTLARFEHSGGSAFAEELLPGRLAWRLRNGSEPDRRAQRDAVGFLRELDRATRREVLLHGPEFDELIGESLTALRTSLSDVPDALAALQSIGSVLEQQLSGAPSPVVRGHGDFGHGNMLCDSESGALLGVIDWDTYVASELPGVDLCNMLLQRYAAQAQLSVAEAFPRVRRNLEYDGPLREFIGSSLGQTDWKVPMTVAAIRYVRRSARYATEFQAAKPKHVRLIEAAAAELTH